MNTRLVMRGVLKQYPLQPTPALEQVHCELDLTKITAVVGRSGSGKSVWSRLATGLEVATRGSVQLLGQELGALTARERFSLHRRAPYFAQQPALLDEYSLVENIALAAETPRQGTSAALHALEQLGLGDHARKYPWELSAGVRRVAALARTLVLQPVVAFLDEPTTGLSREAARIVVGAIEQLHRSGSGLVMITHDDSLVAALANHVVKIHEGKIVFDGGRAQYFSTRPGNAPLS